MGNWTPASTEFFRKFGVSIPELTGKNARQKLKESLYLGEPIKVLQGKVFLELQVMKEVNGVFYTQILGVKNLKKGRGIIARGPGGGFRYFGGTAAEKFLSLKKAAHSAALA